MAYLYNQVDPFKLTNLRLSATPIQAPTNYSEMPALQQESLLPAPNVNYTTLRSKTEEIAGRKISDDAWDTLKEQYDRQTLSTPNLQLQPEQVQRLELDPNLLNIQLNSTAGQLSNLLSNKDFGIYRATHNLTDDSPAAIKKDWENYIQNAKYAKLGSAALTAVGSIMDIKSARDYRKDVEATKSQYEAQKQLIDTNINNTESGLMENLMSNMATLDATMAAKNVDLGSESIAADKAKGAMDLGKDIENMRTQGSLQKAALNLEYAMNVKRARQEEYNSYINSALKIGGAALSLL